MFHLDPLSNEFNDSSEREVAKARWHVLVFLFRSLGCMVHKNGRRTTGDAGVRELLQYRTNIVEIGGRDRSRAAVQAEIQGVNDDHPDLFLS